MTALAGLQRDFLAWLVQEDADTASGLGPAAGLAVYQNNYRSSLMSSLEASFPRVLAWLGETAFAAAAANHIDASPPSSWTLDAYGATFAATLDRLYGEDPEVSELALIDWAVGEAFVASDTVPLNVEALAHVNWNIATIGFVPSLRLLPARTNADAIWLALVDQSAPPAPMLAAEAAAVLVWRQGFESVMRRADAAEVRLLELSLGGASFADCCGALAAHVGDEAAVAEAGNLLGRWIAEGLVASL